MNENTAEAKAAVPAASLADQLKAVEQVRDLFARAHDYIAQAQYPGHMGVKIAEVLNFLLFQHGDFKQRGENISKQLEAEKKAKESVVDVPAAQAAVAATLAPAATPAPEAPKA